MMLMDEHDGVRVNEFAIVAASASALDLPSAFISKHNNH